MNYEHKESILTIEQFTGPDCGVRALHMRAGDSITVRFASDNVIDKTDGTKETIPAGGTVTIQITCPCCKR